MDTELEDDELTLGDCVEALRELLVICAYTDASLNSSVFTEEDDWFDPRVEDLRLPVSGRLEENDRLSHGFTKHLSKVVKEIHDLWEYCRREEARLFLVQKLHPLLTALYRNRAENPNDALDEELCKEQARWAWSVCLGDALLGDTLSDETVDLLVSVSPPRQKAGRQPDGYVELADERLATLLGISASELQKYRKKQRHRWPKASLLGRPFRNRYNDGSVEFHTYRFAHAFVFKSAEPNHLNETFDLLRSRRGYHTPSPLDICLSKREVPEIDIGELLEGAAQHIGKHLTERQVEAMAALNGVPGISLNNASRARKEKTKNGEGVAATRRRLQISSS
ncbi:MAG: hypothetical protein R3A47_06350 [Polyangiales bacterium]